MISKLNKGGGFRGVLGYAIGKDGAKQIGGNMAGSNPRDLASEFGAVRQYNQACKKPVFHASLSLPPGEKLTDEQWNSVARSYLEKMGFDPVANQYAVVRHTDREHDHIHIIANRINQNNFSVAKDNFDFKRTQEACRAVEKEFGLRVTEKTNSKTREIAKGGKADDMRKAVDDALKNSKGDGNAFLADLKGKGIEIKLNQQSTGRVAGITFSKEGAAFKGSELGKNYSWPSIQKRLAGLENAATKAAQKAGQKAGKAFADKVTAKVLGKVVAGHIPGMKAVRTVAKVAKAIQKISKVAQHEA